MRTSEKEAGQVLGDGRAVEQHLLARTSPCLLASDLQGKMKWRKIPLLQKGVPQAKEISHDMQKNWTLIISYFGLNLGE